MKKIVIALVVIFASNYTFAMQKEDKLVETQINLVSQFLDSNNFDEIGNFKPIQNLPPELQVLIAQEMLQDFKVFTWLTNQVQITPMSFSHNDGIVEFRYNKNKRKVLFRLKNSIETLNIKTKKLKIFSQLKGKVAKFAEFNSEGDKILVVLNATLKILDADSGNCIYTLKHKEGINSAKFNDAEDKLLIIADEAVKIFDIKSLKRKNPAILNAFQHGSLVRFAGFYGPNKILAMSYSALKVWDIDTGECLHNFNVGLHLSSFVSYNDLQIVFALSNDHFNLIMWDFNTQKILRTFSFDGPINWLLIIDDDTGYVTLDQSRCVKFWDIKSDKCLNTFNFTDSFCLTSYDRGLTSTDYHIVRLWDLHNNICLNSFEYPESVKNSVINLYEESDFILAKSNSGCHSYLCDVSPIRKIKQALKYSRLEQVILINLLYEMEISNKLIFSKSPNAANVTFDLGKYPHLKNIYDNLSPRLRDILSKHVK